MAAENVLGTQLTLGLLGAGFLQWLKSNPKLSFITQNSSLPNHLVLLLTSAAGALGIGIVWSSAQHSLTITNLDWAVILPGLWLWMKQWAVQFLVHRGAFGSVATPVAALPATLTEKKP